MALIDPRMLLRAKIDPRMQAMQQGSQPSSVQRINDAIRASNEAKQAQEQAMQQQIAQSAQTPPPPMAVAENAEANTMSDRAIAGGSELAGVLRGVRNFQEGMDNRKAALANNAYLQEALRSGDIGKLLMSGDPRAVKYAESLMKQQERQDEAEKQNMKLMVDAEKFAHQISNDDRNYVLNVRKLESDKGAAAKAEAKAASDLKKEEAKAKEADSKKMHAAMKDLDPAHKSAFMRAWSELGEEAALGTLVEDRGIPFFRPKHKSKMTKRDIAIWGKEVEKQNNRQGVRVSGTVPKGEVTTKA